MLMVSTGNSLVAAASFLSRNGTHLPLLRDLRDPIGCASNTAFDMASLNAILLTTGSESYFSTFDPLTGD